MPVGAKEVAWTLVNSYGDKVMDLISTSQPSGGLALSQDHLALLPQGIYYLLSFIDGKSGGVQKVYKIDN